MVRRIVRVPRCIKNSRHPKGVSGIFGTIVLIGFG
ncbi:MAG: hypothetical protein IJX67_04515 [Oscillospiraceae bacterium]|nr:hypothetical protein [Oscillospiraceae bacterium]